MLYRGKFRWRRKAAALLSIGALSSLLAGMLATSASASPYVDHLPTGAAQSGAARTSRPCRCLRCPPRRCSGCRRTARCRRRRSTRVAYRSASVSSCTRRQRGIPSPTSLPCTGTGSGTTPPQHRRRVLGGQSERSQSTMLFNLGGGQPVLARVVAPGGARRKRHLVGQPGGRVEGTEHLGALLGRAAAAGSRTPTRMMAGLWAVPAGSPRELGALV